MSVQVKRSYGGGYVRLVVEGNASGFESNSADIKSKIDVPMTIADARTLAADLEKFAAAEETRVNAKAAADERRSKWRDREIAAGRMRAMSAQGFFRK